MSKKLPKRYNTEAELAQDCLSWLKQDHWETYCEVAPWGGGSARADIIAVRSNIVAAIETKLTLSLALIEQCVNWTRHVHFTWAVVPRPKGGIGRSDFVYKLLESFGVGLVTFDKTGKFTQVLAPKFFRKVKTIDITKRLTEQHKTEIPGVSGKYITPFSLTRDRLVQRVRSAGGSIPLKDAFAELEHHYNSDKTAAACLLTMIRKGVIKELKLRQDGKKMFLEIA